MRSFALGDLTLQEIRSCATVFQDQIPLNSSGSGFLTRPLADAGWNELKRSSNDISEYTERHLPFHTVESGQLRRFQVVASDKELSQAVKRLGDGWAFHLAYRGDELLGTADAEHYYEAAILLLRSMNVVTETGCSDGAIDLLDALVQKGKAQRQIGSAGRAMASFEEAIRLGRFVRGFLGENVLPEWIFGRGWSYYPGKDAVRSKSFSGMFADALREQSELLAEKGGELAALELIEEATEVWRRAAKEGEPEDVDAFSRFLIDRGQNAERRNQWLDATACYEEAAKSVKGLLASGLTKYRQSLGASLFFLAASRKEAGNRAAAIGPVTEAIGIFSELLDEGRSDLAEYLARMWLTKGQLTLPDHPSHVAADCCARGVSHLRNLVIDGGRADLTDLWKDALRLLDFAAKIAGGGFDSSLLNCYEVLAQSYRDLLDVEGNQWAEKFGHTQLKKAECLTHLGHYHAAAACQQQCGELMIELFEQTSQEVHKEIGIQATINSMMYNEMSMQERVALFYYLHGIDGGAHLEQFHPQSLSPELLTGLHKKLHRWVSGNLWAEAAGDVILVLSRGFIHLRTGSIPNELRQAWEDYWSLLRGCDVESRSELYAALGNWGAVVKQILEEGIDRES